MQIQSYLGLPPISILEPDQAYSLHPPSISAPSTQLASADSLDMLAAVVAPQPAQDEDDLPPATH